MSRYERVNLHARYRATPLGQAAAVREWEVRFCEPGGAANSAFYASRRDALADMDRETARGRACEGPFAVRR
jgi:hypothetical protein